MSTICSVFFSFLQLYSSWILHPHRIIPNPDRDIVLSRTLQKRRSSLTVLHSLRPTETVAISDFVSPCRRLFFWQANGMNRYRSWESVSYTWIVINATGCASAQALTFGVNHSQLLFVGSFFCPHLAPAPTMGLLLHPIRIMRSSYSPVFQTPQTASFPWEVSQRTARMQN